MPSTEPAGSKVDPKAKAGWKAEQFRLLLFVCGSKTPPIFRPCDTDTSVAVRFTNRGVSIRPIGRKDLRMDEFDLDPKVTKATGAGWSTLLCGGDLSFTTDWTVNSF
jgi:hypothetical protein